MKILLSTGSLYTFPIELVFKVVKTVGFDGVEWIYSSPFDPDKARKLAGSVPILSVHAPFFKSKEMGNIVKGFKKAVDFAKKVGADLVVVHPPCLLDPQFRLLFFFLLTKDFCLEYGGGRVLISIENMPYWGRGRKKFPAYLGGTIGGLYKLCVSKNLFITFDTCHLGTKYPDKLVEAFNILYETGRVVNIHFSDYKDGAEHLLPGKGILPLDDFLHNLSSVGYKEKLTVELDPGNLPKDQKDIFKTMEWVYHYIKSKTFQDEPDALSI